MADILPEFDGLINKIWHSKAEDLLTALPDESIDLIVTSPPYDKLRDYKGFEWDFETIAKESYRVLKTGGVLVWIVGDATVNGSETLTSFRQGLYFVDTVGFRMHDTMIYQKNVVTNPDTKRYYQCFEYMFVLSKGKPKTVCLLKERINKQAKQKVNKTERGVNGELSVSNGTKAGKTVAEYGAFLNVWLIDTGFMKSTSDESAYEHPAIFPEELARRHIATWSNENEIVLDFFSGSGTTAKMALSLNRRYIACDISEEYCILARNRLAKAQGQSYITKSGMKQIGMFDESKGEVRK